MTGKDKSVYMEWSNDSFNNITSSLSSLYCLFVITVYVVITINKFVTTTLKNDAEVEVMVFSYILIREGCKN